MAGRAGARGGNVFPSKLVTHVRLVACLIYKICLPITLEGRGQSEPQSLCILILHLEFTWMSCLHVCMCTALSALCVCVRVRAWCPRKPEEATGSSEMGVPDGCEPGTWELETELTSSSRVTHALKH